MTSWLLVIGMLTSTPRQTRISTKLNLDRVDSVKSRNLSG